MATIKFSEFNAGNINVAGAQLVGLTGGNTATNARFTAADLVNGLATVTYVDSQDAGLQSQITQNTNDIANIDLSGLQSNVSTLQGQVSVLQGNIVVLDSAVAALENNVTVNSDDIAVLQGNVIQIENDLANINTDSQTLSWDGANANLAISNGNNVVLQEVLDNAGNISSAQQDIQNLVINQNAIALNVSNNSSNITVMQGQIADLQANGNIQTLSLDNSSNVLSISGGNTVDFTTVLGNVAGGGGAGSNYGNANVTAYAEAGWAGNIIPSANITYDLGTLNNRWKDLYLSNSTIYLGDSTISNANGSLAVNGQVLENTFSTSTPVLNTNTDVYANNGVGNPTGAPLPSPDKKNGWYWISPGGSGTDRSIQWRLYNNAGPQNFAVEDVDYIYMVVDLKALGDVYFNIYTMDAFPNVPSSFNKRFTFALNGSHSSTGTYLLWAKPPGSTTTVDQVAVYQQFPRIELPFQSAFSTGTIADVGETIKNIAITTSTSVGAGDVEFTLKTTGYKVSQGLIQDFNPVVGNPFDQDLNTTDFVKFSNLSIEPIDEFEFGLGFVNASTNYATILADRDTGALDIRTYADLSDINITADGDIVLAGLTWPTSDGTANQVLATDGNGNLTFVTSSGGGLAAVVDDTSPQLGGTLNTNGFNIEVSSSSPLEFGIEWNDGSGTKYGDIVAQPDSNEFEISSGSGARDLILVGDRDVEIKTGLTGRDIIIGDLTWPDSDGTPNQVLVTDGSGQLSFAAGGVRLANLDIANATISSNSATNSMDVQFDSKPVAKITSGVMVQVHGSWDASAGAGFNWATDEIASHGISSVTRDSTGIYTVTFETPFASDRYTATFGVGSTDYSGGGASPREVSLLSRNAGNCQVICERSDDAVNEDNFYMSLMICGII